MTLDFSPIIIGAIMLVRWALGYQDKCAKQRRFSAEHRIRIAQGKIGDDEWSEARSSIPPSLSVYDAQQLEKTDA